MTRRLSACVALAVVCSSAPGLAAVDETKKACAARAGEAQRLEHEEKLLAAREALKFCARDECPSIVARDCRIWLADLSAVIPSVVFFSRDPSRWREVRIWIDGDRRVDKLDGKPIMMDPGIHMLRVEVGSYRATQEIVVIKGDKNRRIEVSVPPTVVDESSAPVPPGQPRPLSSEKTVGRSTPASAYFLAGAGVVAVSVAGYLGVTAIAERSDLRDRCYPSCDPDDVTSTTHRLMAADIVGLVGLASLGGALWIYLDSESEVRVGTSRQGEATWGVLSGRF